MSISILPRALCLEPRLKWTAAQEKSIFHDYPFPDLSNESAEQFVVRSYLQFLWLPEVRNFSSSVFASFSYKLVNNAFEPPCSISPSRQPCLRLQHYAPSSPCAPRTTLPHRSFVIKQVPR